MRIPLVRVGMPSMGLSRRLAVSPFALKLESDVSDDVELCCLQGLLDHIAVTELQHCFKSRRAIQLLA